MTLKALIERLEAAGRVERIFDGEIGTLLGWRRKVEYVKNDANGEPTKRVFWLSHRAKTLARFPISRRRLMQP
ncbi:hypothetical protein [Sinorhizobium psoraleae]|uniref:Uncharacterized protein n=1 Tax=Sinorhizobium psoraleae TaxID=520838 RepID=A0ABT4KME8_9HYPH|nr:hypothetical protein [Sinorhizobium psoraleae]MCZ4093039.1 hypothetical protein [Sinorhizobium psoraleae]